LNPSKLTVVRKKLEQWVLTKAGFERIDWGQNVIEFAYTGSSGAFRLDEPIPGAVAPQDVQDLDIRNTQAWAKFAEFEKFFRNTEEEFLEMTYWGQPYNHQGSIGDFQYDLDADTRPWSIAYRFKFTAKPDKSRPDVVVTGAVGG